jgi:hypothetical protein
MVWSRYLEPALLFSIAKRKLEVQRDLHPILRVLASASFYSGIGHCVRIASMASIPLESTRLPFTLFQPWLAAFCMAKPCLRLLCFSSRM